MTPNIHGDNELFYWGKMEKVNTMSNCSQCTFQKMCNHKANSKECDSYRLGRGFDIYLYQPIKKPFEVEWFEVDNLPKNQCHVLVMATCKNYQLGYPQMLTGYFQDEYYGIPVNKFRLVGVSDAMWTPVLWAYAPNNPPIKK